MTACAACHGYGTADGEPAGDLPRDTYDDPGPCSVCDGSGVNDHPRGHLRTYPVVLDDSGTVEWRTEGVRDGSPQIGTIDTPNCRCVAVILDPPDDCKVCEGTGTARGCARHGGQCDGSDRGCTDSYPCECGAGEVEP